MSGISVNQEYKNWIVELKNKIQQSQIKAALAVNSQLILVYWDLGKQIVEKQEKAKWGSGFIDQLSKDLKAEFPDIGGFSSDNLRYCRVFYLFYKDFSISEQVVRKIEKFDLQIIAQSEQLVLEINREEIAVKWQEFVSKIPWGHHIIILKKIKEQQKAHFYIQKTIENSWSRAVLLHQIESDLYGRQGKAVNNFASTLPAPQSDLAKELLKDPYNFGFLEITEKYNELDLEKALTNQITNFLLELGAGFSFVGKQFGVKLSNKEYLIDLLFYHLKLRCFIVIELKVVAFEPEFAGKLNFYLNIIDDQLKHPTDNPTIGIVICKTKDTIEAEYALRGINKPIGISEYELNKILPEAFRGSLPTIEEIESKLKEDFAE